MYKFEDGSFTNHPTSRQQALHDRKSKYCEGDKCPKCGSLHIRYVTTDNCHYCTVIKMQRVAWIKQNGPSVPYPDELIKPYDSATEPMNDGVEVWEYSKIEGTVAMHPCKHGHIHIKNDGGKCIKCLEMQQSRALAKENRETWYKPPTPCRNCGEFALRNVHNGRCQGCHPLKQRGIDNASSALMRDNPDMIISRNDAKALGFKVYRTGEECKNGHVNWRQTSNGGCLSCLRESQRKWAEGNR